MVLPLGVLTAAQGHPMLVELKSGETLNGHLVQCDTWMNLTLREVVQTSPDGDKFMRLPEVYVKGNHIKYVQVQDEILDIVKEQDGGRQGGFRGGRGGQGRGDHGGRGGGDRGRGGRGQGRGRGRGRGGGRDISSLVILSGDAHVTWRLNRAGGNTPSIFSTLTRNLGPPTDAIINQTCLNQAVTTTTRSSRHFASNGAAAAIPTTTTSNVPPSRQQWVVQPRRKKHEKQNLKPPVRGISDPTSAQEIYAFLHSLRHSTSQHVPIRRVVDFLVKYHGSEKKKAVDMRIYEALAVANWDPSGSAGELTSLFARARKEGGPLSLGFLHAVLKGLAVHPHYLLRIKVLHELRELGSSRSKGQQVGNGDEDVDAAGLTADARGSLALGLLRDGQLEMAVDFVEDMLDRRVPFPAWVLDVVICVLAKRGHADVAVQLMTRRHHHHSSEVESSASAASAGEGASASAYSLWYLLLDHCVAQHRYRETKFIWDELVERRGISPSDGTVTDLLGMAARVGDDGLASRALEVLAGRMRLAVHHYEAMVECYATKKDLRAAMGVLCIMLRAGIQPEAGSTRAIYSLLLTRDEGVEEAVGVLEDLRGEYNDLPVAAVDVVLEGLCRKGHVDRAVALYGDIPRLCTEGPSSRTLGLVLQHASEPAHALFALKQLELSTVPRRPFMFRDIMRCALVAGDPMVAYRVLVVDGEEDKQGVAWEDRDLVLRAVHALARCEGEERAREVLEVAGGRLDLEGVDVEALINDGLEEGSLEDEHRGNTVGPPP
ncbi:hypothetical protein QBC47DRAFT_337292 [Echria macrotheca]|uniref:Sm domain-containing protein n=1 Tax=Echria macrotheca TaxID=438768 RepID=A0AAJ0BK15_9PEZI|nr:hypothetical protein QBC47DRAFT_337292 [Echria macrotheca]